MTAHLTPEERELIKLIADLPVAEEHKTRWDESIQQSGLTEELAEEIRKELTTAGGAEGLGQARYTTHLHNIIQHWRFSRQSKSFKKH
jgi:hypothetical protein